MNNSPGKLIFTAYQDENNNVRLAIAPQFNTFATDHEYYIDLGDILMKMTIENARKLEGPPVNDKQQEESNDGS